jgi:hypothetical protein
MLQAPFGLTKLSFQRYWSTLNMSQQGSIEWRMHDSQTIASVA